ncbi:MAG: hypothetical protein QM781_20510 [Chitinophagaceae bacterium]
MKRILFFLLILTIYTGCSKDNEHTAQSIDCVALKQAVTNDEVAVVKELINEFAANIQAPASLNGFNEYKFLIDELAKRLKTSCGISVEVLCYACIDTLPAQTEVRLKFSAGLVSIEKTLDLIVTDDNQVRCVNMHD